MVLIKISTLLLAGIKHSEEMIYTIDLDKQHNLWRDRR